jgi:hypothetical protein
MRQHLLNATMLRSSWIVSFQLRPGQTLLQALIEQ